MSFRLYVRNWEFFGAALLLLMFGYLLYRLFFIAQNAPDLYGTLVVTGIFVHIALQVILNLCVVLNLMLQPVSRFHLSATEARRSCF